MINLVYEIPREYPVAVSVWCTALPLDVRRWLCLAVSIALYFSGALPLQAA